MPAIKLIAGLGNPGAKYGGTRHNLGFDALDRFAEKNSLSWKSWDSSGLIARLDGESKAVLLKPQNFMNNSGQAVKGLMSYLKIKHDELLVVVDDFALPLGKMRLRTGGSAGGHNGLSSIIEHIGTSEFARLRLGMGPLPEKTDPADFVLSDFSALERKDALAMIDRSADLIHSVLSLGVEKAISKIT